MLRDVRAITGGMILREEYVCCLATLRRRVIHVLGVLLWALAAGPDAVAQDTAAQPVVAQSRFVRTIITLQDAAPELRSDFATVALSRLADAYSAEASLARRNEQGAGVRAWTATVEQYASQIYLLLDDVQLGLPVQLAIEGDGSLAIAVGDRTAIISHPRLSQQGALEQAILKDFCAEQECGQIQPDQRSLEPIAASRTFIRPAWNFTARGSECSHEGITVRFSNDQNTAHARLICEQFLQEVMALVDELAGQQRHAVEIQWAQLELQSIPGRPEHLVRINALGDSALLAAPLLHANPELLQRVLQWLRQWLETSSKATLEIDAAHYGWQEP
jgi:hypothetical protein